MRAMFILVYSFSLATCYKHEKFRAAVYEHATFPPNKSLEDNRAEALGYMMKNLETFKLVAEKAARQNVDIIVFPEGGITFPLHTRNSIKPFLEYIPDPKEVRWNACEDHQRYPNTEVQNMLSCIAKNNTMYLVANMADMQPCENISDPTCPSDGQYQFNTDVVYDPSGLLIARYHKINLFYEFQYDTSISKEAVYFDTIFGRFGVFTCFDILFRNPVVKLIRDEGIRNIVFPTAWMDTKPFFSAIQFHSSFAAGLKINFLAANLHYPSYRVHGSGIYSPDGARTFYYDNSLTSGGKLLISDLNTLDHNLSFKTYYDNYRNTKQTVTSSASTNPKVFQAEAFSDMFNFVALENQEGYGRVCHETVCCHLSYKMKESSQELFALGAFDGLHRKEGSYYIQVCALLRCKNRNWSSCGEGSTQSATKFTHLRIHGNFRSPYIFPEVLLFGNQSLQLARPGDWTYNNGVLEAINGLQLPVLSFTLFSRDYDNDLLLSSHSPLQTPQLLHFACCVLLALSFKSI